ncbi:MAG: helix-turn-helix transcriptional regulator [Burkholderiales bacterium]|nr:helix-turn-helix transcriptional regulator [Burkholderiales bacterium]
MSALHPAAAPHPLTTLRRARRVSQLELSLRAGVSQRHLSCIETGRARPTRATLLALLDALDAPLAERNAALLAAGLAPQYSQHGLQDAALAPARQALDAMLQAPGAAPALVLDADWNLLSRPCEIHPSALRNSSRTAGQLIRATDRETV